MEDSSTKSWDEIAEDWVKHADSNDYRNIFLIPKTLELLGNVEGKQLLELGCGEGGYARALALAGAQVTVVDGSPTLIEIAKKRALEKGLIITHLVRNANSLNGLEDGSFDMVLAAMSLMDIEDYRGSISEIHRVLKNEGELLMSITHPCFSSKDSGWRRGETGRFDHYAVDNYFQKGAWEEFITDNFKKPVLFRHMPLEDFISPLLSLDFRLVLFHEPVPTQQQIAQSQRLQRLTRIPLFLFMKWRK